MATQRRAERVQFQNPVQAGFMAGDERFAGSIGDFSPFGLGVKTPHRVTPGAVYRLGIKVDTGYFRAAAIVRTKSSDGFGAEFLSMSPVDRELLRRLYMSVRRALRLEPAP
jgi:hypothetical protein